ncbi:MAG: hypothetical protein JF611_02635 [Betaproteobacteria bacterium]|nr:hypothetical protein [Betaproteobacteria bacterium]
MAGRLHRKLRNRLTLTCQALALMVAAPAYAARPFVTDDARIVEHCQVETFYKEQRTYSGSEFWLLPACNPFGFEITVGGNRIEGEQNEILQTKFLLKPLAPNDIGFALSLGVFGSDPYFNFITSRSFADDRLVVHGNLGSFRDAGGTWGLGLEALLLASRVYGILETFGQHRETPTWHYGIRFWVIPDRFQIDATRGEQTGTGNRQFYTVGLRFLF